MLTSRMFLFFLVGNFEFLGIDLAGYRVITNYVGREISDIKKGMGSLFRLDFHRLSFSRTAAGNRA